MVAPPAGFSPQILGRLAELETALGSAIRGKPEVVRLSLVCLLARGHLLIEDVPGVGKTTLAQALARSVSCRFHRLQFTSDMLPSDVLGVTIYNAHSEAFEFKPGPDLQQFPAGRRNQPHHAQDPIGAARSHERSARSPSTAQPHSLPRPFMVIATQNPVEHHGTYPLPESQLDRFLMRLRIGYPDAASERQIVRNTERALPEAVGLGAGGRRRAAASGRRAPRHRGRRAGGLHARHRREDAQPRIADAGREPARLAGAVPRGAGAGAAGRPRLRHPRRRQAAGRARSSRTAWSSIPAPPWCSAAPMWASASSKRSSARWKFPCRSSLI